MTLYNPHNLYIVDSYYVFHRELDISCSHISVVVKFSIVFFRAVQLLLTYCSSTAPMAQVTISITNSEFPQFVQFVQLGAM